MKTMDRAIENGQECEKESQSGIRCGEICGPFELGGAETFLFFSSVIDK